MSETSEASESDEEKDQNVSPSRSTESVTTDKSSRDHSIINPTKEPQKKRRNSASSLVKVKVSNLYLRTVKPR